MFAGFRCRGLISILPAPVTAVLCAVVWCSIAQADDPPEVRGVLAGQVYFSGDAREKAATAVLELLASCTASGTASEHDWVEAPHGKCHLHFKFVKPRTVTVAIGRLATIETGEMVITFPLSNGRIWLRSGDRYTWFAKYRPELCKPIQELLKDAMPCDIP